LFCYTFKTSFSGHNTFWGAQKTVVMAPESRHPVAMGLKTSRGIVDSNAYGQMTSSC